MRIVFLRLARLQYRKLLEARDGWHRSIIEHAILSGRRQTFETVFEAMRRDILDEKVSTPVKSSLSNGAPCHVLYSPAVPP